MLFTNSSLIFLKKNPHNLFVQWLNAIILYYKIILAGGTLFLSSVCFFNYLLITINARKFRYEEHHFNWIFMVFVFHFISQMNDAPWSYKLLYAIYKCVAICVPAASIPIFLETIAIFWMFWIKTATSSTKYFVQCN